MLSCHKLWLVLSAIVILLENNAAKAQPLAEANNSNSSQLELITDDVIQDDVEKAIKKVIRVNPLDLPSLKDDPNDRNTDSDLYNIQSLKPYTGKRKYVNMQRARPLNERTSQLSFTESPIIRGLSAVATADKTSKPKHRPKKKQLHFLYNQENLAGNLLSKTMPFHVAPGAYPVYYVVAKTNGRFGKYPLKSFSSYQAFLKYLQKNKLENIPAVWSKEELE